MKTLLILRHAKSSWKDDMLADHDRPLNRRGKEDAPRMGALLAEEGLIPDVILSSTAKRARSTADTVAESSGYDGEIVYTRDLYHADPESYLYVLRAQPASHESVMVVGHNPGLEELVDVLTGESQRLPTCALVQVSLPLEGWEALTDETEGTLVNIWRPREIH
jgi:phosphohistidine phosphatase